jgi:hypothetical protein
MDDSRGTVQVSPTLTGNGRRGRELAVTPRLTRVDTALTRSFSDHRINSGEPRCRSLLTAKYGSPPSRDVPSVEKMDFLDGKLLTGEEVILENVSRQRPHQEGNGPWLRR